MFGDRFVAESTMLLSVSFAEILQFWFYFKECLLTQQTHVMYLVRFRAFKSPPI